MTEHEHKPVENQETVPVAAHQATPAAAPVAEASPARLTRLKTAFMYVLIAGLAAAAITSVIALLVGQFTSGIGKSLLTILIFFSHSLLILAILWADRFNQVGKLVLPTTIALLVFFNMISTTLGTWELISTETAWRAFSMYFLILGAAFIVVGLLRLRLQQQATQVAIYSSIGLIVITVLALIPWVLNVVEDFDALYFRIVAALSILATTALLIGVVIRAIALGRNEALKLTAPAKTQTPGGLLAIYITVGVITSIVWCVGLTAFLVDGIQSSYPNSRNDSTNRYY